MPFSSEYSDYPHDPPKNTTITPPTSVENKTGEMIIRCEMPGVQKDKIDVSVKNSNIIIVGEKIRPESNKNTSQEIIYGTYRKYIHISEGVVISSLVAKYTSGILVITMKVLPTDCKIPVS